MGTLEFFGETPGRRVFIAGAGGPVGNAFCPLLRWAWHATASTPSGDKVKEIEAQGVKALVLDPLDAEALRAAVVAARPAIVVSLLSDQSPSQNRPWKGNDRLRNIYIRETGTHNLIAAAIAAGVTRIVALSSSTSYATGSMPYTESARLDASANDVISLERQIEQAPLDSVILRLGHLYGRGTGFDLPHLTPSLHVDAAAEATRLALISGSGVYNLADDNATVNSQRAKLDLDWRPAFRASSAKEAARIADSIWRLTTSSEPVPNLSPVSAFLQKNLEQRETKLLFDKFFDQCWGMTWGGDELEGAQETLHTLEALMPVFSLGACVLMAHLFARADRLKAKYSDDDSATAAKRAADYICDSIIVWILTTKSPELKAQLEYLAEDTPDQHLKDRYRKWAGTM